jgi:hypothetical protein
MDQLSECQLSKEHLIHIFPSSQLGSDLVAEERLSLPIMNVKLHKVDLHDIAGEF